MSFNLVHIDLLSSLLGFAVGLASYFFIHKYQHQSNKPTLTEPNELLHWDPLVERRGLGDLITKVNHLAITVADVGRSLGFYVDVLGLQQIRRPTFDRHGAWLTMGNIELHLIKGIPCTPLVDNLQVEHIALETSNVDEVIGRLYALNIDVRQSFNVTNAHKSMSKRKSHITQYFFNDPDGYYIELCNCDVLTDFALNRKASLDDLGYTEGIHNGTVFEIAHVATHWRARSRNRVLEHTHPATQVDEQKLENLIRRRATYGDLIQGFDDHQIREALIESNNDIPLTIKLLEQKRGENHYFQPPAFIENDHVVEPQPFIMKHGSYSEN